MSSNSIYPLILPDVNEIPIIDDAQRYVYIDYTKDNIPFYVGIGSISRLLDPKRNKQHRGICISHDECFRVIHSVEDFNSAKIKEIELIQKFGRLDLKNGSLCNHTNGGDGGDTIGNRKWFNNQIDSEGYYIPGKEPNGWIRGRLKKNCVFCDSYKQKELSLRGNTHIHKEIRSKLMKEKWENGEFDSRIIPEYDRSHSEETKKKLSELAVKRWENEEYRNVHIKLYNADKAASKRKELVEMRKQYCHETNYKEYKTKIKKSTLLEYFNMGPKILND